MPMKLSISRIRGAKGVLRGRRFSRSNEDRSEGKTSPSSVHSFPVANGAVATATRVQEIITTALGAKIPPAALMRMGDAHYYLPTLSEVQQLLKASALDRRTWLSERFDCDDFSHVLKGEFSIHAYDAGDISYGFSAGIIWGNFSWAQGYHAVNLIVTDDQVLRLIEPQNDTIYGANQCQNGVGLVLV